MSSSSVLFLFFARFLKVDSALNRFRDRWADFRLFSFFVSREGGRGGGGGGGGGIIDGGGRGRGGGGGIACAAGMTFFTTADSSTGVNLATGNLTRTFVSGGGSQHVDNVCASASSPEVAETRFSHSCSLLHLFFLSLMVTLSMAFASSDFVFFGSLSNTRLRSSSRDNLEPLISLRIFA
tara:strand:- start:295 stop:834 length:540 start_codon:yes stop_codon:yes gene_type:complete